MYNLVRRILFIFPPEWTHYFSIYEAIFGPVRREPLRILEIGIWHGASLKLWRQYFDNAKSIIVGVDVLPECIRYDAPAAGIHIRIGSQADPACVGSRQEGETGFR